MLRSLRKTPSANVVVGSSASIRVDGGPAAAAPVSTHKGSATALSRRSPPNPVLQTYSATARRDLRRLILANGSVIRLPLKVPANRLV